MSTVEEAYKRAVSATSGSDESLLRTSLSELHSSWDQLGIDLKSVRNNLSTSAARWNEFTQSLSGWANYLSSVEQRLADSPTPTAELGEMKTKLERSVKLLC